MTLYSFYILDLCIYVFIIIIVRHATTKILHIIANSVYRYVIVIDQLPSFVQVCSKEAQSPRDEYFYTAYNIQSEG